MSTLLYTKGENLDLCAFRADDEAIKIYTRWLNDVENRRFIGHSISMITKADEEKYATTKEPGEYKWNIVTHDEKLIGNCSILLKGRNAILGILIGDSENKGKGYGTEVIKMLIKFAFEDLNAHRVALTLSSVNERAYSCYTKCGFIECGREHEVDFWDGQYHDCIHMEILEDDYYKR